jgi:hypothetical protein
LVSDAMATGRLRVQPEGRDHAMQKRLCSKQMQAGSWRCLRMRIAFWNNSPPRSHMVQDVRRRTLFSTPQAKHECWAGGVYYAKEILWL